VEFDKEVLKLGKVSYINTLPLFYGWSLPFVHIREGVPSELAKLLEFNLLDGGILSSVYYLRNKEKFILLPDVSISSFGKVLSVLLFSEKPLEEIETVSPSPESLTSNFLTYAIFKKFLKKPVVFTPEGADAFLLIGDKALKQMPASRGYVYDIGELWYKFTNLPAVFALFLVPKRWAYKNPDKFSKLSLSVLEGRENFFGNLEKLDLSEETKNYLLTLDYHFRDEHLESLKLLEKLLRDYYLNNL
jgi:chorismate dehydratase